MPITKQQLGLLALQTLKVIDGNDTSPEPNDTLVIEQAYDSVYAMLSRKALVTWPLLGPIPDEFVNPIVYLVAYSRLSVFDPDPEAMQIISVNSSLAIGDITELIQIDNTHDVIYSEDF